MPNVLLITADQMRGDCLSAAGHPVVRTPRMDALAAEGALFLNHFGVAAPCGPARASLLTGLYTANHRSVNNGVPLPRRHANIALEVRRAGLDAFLMGYTDTAPEPEDFPPEAPDFRHFQGILRGFHPLNFWRDDVDMEWIAALARAGFDIPENPADIYLPPVPSLDGKFTRAAARYPAEKSDTAFTADRALDFIRTHRGDFFLHLVFFRPHPPLIAPPPYNEMYQSAPPPIRCGTPEAEAARHPFLAAWLARQDDADSRAEAGIPAASAADDDEIQMMRAVYFGLISEVDFHLGRVLDGLKECGRESDTLVIFTSDHGECLGDHYCWGKGGWQDASQHVPLIVRDPKAKRRGARVREFTESVDIAPAILDWLGLDAPPALNGESLLPLARGNPAPREWRKAATWEFDFRDMDQNCFPPEFRRPSDQRAMTVRRGRRWKYVRFNGLPPLLFDMESDPGEFDNLAARPEFAARCAECAGEMMDWRMIHSTREYADMRVSPAGMRRVER